MCRRSTKDEQLAELRVELESVRAELAAVRAEHEFPHGPIYYFECAKCGHARTIGVSPREIRDNQINEESEWTHRARVADLLAPQTDRERAAALGEMRESMEARERQRERELRTEALQDAAEVANLLHHHTGPHRRGEQS